VEDATIPISVARAIIGHTLLVQQRAAVAAIGRADKD
jgi:hypothetical protein